MWVAQTGALYRANFEKCRREINGTGSHKVEISSVSLKPIFNSFKRQVCNIGLLNLISGYCSIQL
jgi:hypothetical protein